MNSLSLALKVLDNKQKNKLFLILGLIIVAMLLETLSFAVIVPFLSLATNQSMDPNIEKLIHSVKNIVPFDVPVILIAFLSMIFLLKNILMRIIHFILAEIPQYY